MTLGGMKELVTTKVPVFAHNLIFGRDGFMAMIGLKSHSY